MDAATNVNGANGNHEKKLSRVEESSETTSTYEKIDETEHNDSKRKLDKFYDNKEEPLNEGNVIHQVKKRRNSSKIFSHDEGIINSVPLYKLMYASYSQSVDTKVATDVEKLKGKSKDLIDNYSEEEWDSDASDENDSSSIDDDNVNQDTLAIAKQVKPQFDSMEEINENCDTSLSKEAYEMDRSNRDEHSQKTANFTIE